MSSLSYNTQLLEMAKLVQQSGMDLYPRQEDDCRVVTPQQVLDLGDDVTVSFEDCRSDPFYFLILEWEDTKIRLSKYQTEKFTRTYGPYSWDLIMFDGPHPF
jgi:hypothetical protein